MAAAITDHQPVPQIPLPLGFPVIVSILDRVGLGSSFFFVLANCLFLGVGLFSLWQLLRDCPARVRQTTVVFTLLAVPVVKSVPIALPEAAFFGCSLLALSLMTLAGTASQRRRVVMLGAAFVLTALATSIRLVGVALIAPMVWACLTPATVSASRESRGPNRVFWISVVAVLLGALLVLVARSYTFYAYSIMTEIFYTKHGLLAALGKRISLMASGWGEIVLNLPFARFKNLRPIFVAAGVVSALILAASTRKPHRLTLAPIYLTTYLIAIALWPNPSPRLWMPIVPLLIAEVILAIDRLPRTRWTTIGVGAYASWFALTGLIALAYTSRISLAGEDFPRLYGKNGGMANPEITEGTRGWEHIKVYRIEARKVLSRYGGLIVAPQE
jgi:hypothetical protein